MPGRILFTVLAIFGHLIVSAQNPFVLSKADSLILKKIDNLKIPRLDTLINTSPWDSLLKAEMRKIDSVVNHTNRKIDSLQGLRLPTLNYEKKLDSLLNLLTRKLNLKAKQDSINSLLQTKLKNGIETKDSLQSAVLKQLYSLQSKINSRLSFLDSMNISLNTGMGNDVLSKLDVEMPRELSNLSKVNINQPLTDNVVSNKLKEDLPKIKVPDGIENVNQKINEVQQLPDKKMEELGLSEDITKIKGYVAKVEEFSEKADTYREEIKDLTEGNLNKLEALPKEAEKAALKVSEVQEFNTQQQKFTATKNMLHQYTEMAQSMKSDELVDKGKDLAKKELPDYFADEQAKLKAGIAQLDKLKRKYKTIADSRYLPKQVPNEMKGKPFGQRIVPGLGFQIFKTDQPSIDVAPYLAYKLSGRLRPGLGVSWRYALNFKDPEVKYDEVFGARVFNDFRWYRALYLHTEAEWLKFSEAAFAKYKYPVDEGSDLLQFRFNVGLFKTYTISKRFTGQMLLLYDVADLKDFPQTKSTSFRFGIEYKFKQAKGD